MTFIVQTRPQYKDYIDNVYIESDENKMIIEVIKRDYDITEDMLASFYISQRQGEYYNITEETKQIISVDAIEKTEIPYLFPRINFMKNDGDFYYMLEYGDGEY